LAGKKVAGIKGLRFGFGPRNPRKKLKGWNSLIPHWGPGVWKGLGLVKGGLGWEGDPENGGWEGVKKTSLSD